MEIDKVSSEAVAEALIAVAAAIGEQIDLQRLLQALEKQYDGYKADASEGAQETAAILASVGQTLNGIALLREKRTTPGH